jgi:hypothetical protein
MSGMRTKLFGADSPEVKREKMEKVEQEINETEMKLRQVNEELK